MVFDVKFRTDRSWASILLSLALSVRRDFSPPLASRFKCSKLNPLLVVLLFSPAPQVGGQTLPGNLATTNDVQRIVEAHSHGSRRSNSPPPVNLSFAAPPAGFPTQSYAQPNLQPTQAAPPVVVVGGGGNNPPGETTRIIREEGGGEGGGRGGILSRLAEGVVPDATRRAENAAALGERRREDDMRRETEQRRGDQLRSEEGNRESFSPQARLIDRRRGLL